MASDSQTSYRRAPGRMAAAIGESLRREHWYLMHIRIPHVTLLLLFLLLLVGGSSSGRPG
jgi:hypothetical protein